MLHCGRVDARLRVGRGREACVSAGKGCGQKRTFLSFLVASGGGASASPGARWYACSPRSRRCGTDTLRGGKKADGKAKSAAARRRRPRALAQAARDTPAHPVLSQIVARVPTTSGATSGMAALRDTSANAAALLRGCSGAADGPAGARRRERRASAAGCAGGSFRSRPVQFRQHRQRACATAWGNRARISVRSFIQNFAHP